MRENILTSLNNANQWYQELRPFAVVLPQNLMDGANQAYRENIPNAINQILSLLNAVSGTNRFDEVNSINQAITLFENKVEELESALALVPKNQNIIGLVGGNNISAQQILENMSFWVNAHCDTINTILIAGRLTAKHRRR